MAMETSGPPERSARVRRRRAARARLWRAEVVSTGRIHVDLGHEMPLDMAKPIVGTVALEDVTVMHKAIETGTGKRFAAGQHRGPFDRGLQNHLACP